MKPYLLMLLLAIPPLVCSLLTCENAEPPAAAPAPKSLPASKDTATVTPIPRTVTPPPAAPPKPVPSAGIPAQHKAWYM